MCKKTYQYFEKQIIIDFLFKERQMFNLFTFN